MRSILIVWWVISVCWNVGCGGSEPQLLLKINEVFTKSNVPGQTDWLEIYNPSRQEVSLKGIQLKDVKTGTVWSFPDGQSIGPQGYLQVFCDDTGTGLHTNFKLSSKGETIVMQTVQGQEIDKVAYPGQKENTSWGRSTDGGNEWKEFSSPSPGKTNG